MGSAAFQKRPEVAGWDWCRCVRARGALGFRTTWFRSHGFWRHPAKYCLVVRDGLVSCQSSNCLPEVAALLGIDGLGTGHVADFAACVDVYQSIYGTKRPTRLSAMSSCFYISCPDGRGGDSAAPAKGRSNDSRWDARLRATADVVAFPISLRSDPVAVRASVGGGDARTQLRSFSMSAKNSCSQEACYWFGAEARERGGVPIFIFFAATLLYRVASLMASEAIDLHLYYTEPVRCAAGGRDGMVCEDRFLARESDEQHPVAELPVRGFESESAARDGSRLRDSIDGRVGAIWRGCSATSSYIPPVPDRRSNCP